MSRVIRAALMIMQSTWLKAFGKGTTVQNTEAPKEIKEQPARNEQAAKQEAVATAPQTKMSR